VFDTLSNLKLELLARSALLPQTYAETIVQISEQGSRDFRDKAVYTDYMFIVKQASAKVFKDMKTLLEQMKTIKKQAR
jgi:hypothetical protein